MVKVDNESNIDIIFYNFQKILRSGMKYRCHERKIQTYLRVIKAIGQKIQAG
jgi:hypothetical protein